MPLAASDYIDTIKESEKIRYKYYGVANEYEGTIFADLEDGTIQDNTHFYNKQTIDETIKFLESDFLTIGFWILWIALTGAITFGFYYIDNNWLE